MATEAGEFTLVTPVIESYEPKSAGPDETVTIKGRGFGTFLKTAEHARLDINQKAYKRRQDFEINEAEARSTVLSNVSRTEVLFNGTAAVVESWTDTEIVVKVPHRNRYGIGRRGEFFDDLATGPLVVRRGSWDVLPDGTCCTPKQRLTVEAGPFTIEAKGLPDQGYFTGNRPDANTNQQGAAIVDGRARTFARPGSDEDDAQRRFAATGSPRGGDSQGGLPISVGVHGRQLCRAHPCARGSRHDRRPFAGPAAGSNGASA